LQRGEHLLALDLDPEVELRSVALEAIANDCIFGIMGALVVAGRRLGYDVRQVLVLIGINVVLGFIPGGNVDWRAHLGGLVVGALTAAVMVHAPRRSRALWQTFGVLAILGALVLVAMWRTAAILQLYS
jgi:membrane associated rhomboid family serine protease